MGLAGGLRYPTARNPVVNMDVLLEEGGEHENRARPGWADSRDGLTSGCESGTPSAEPTTPPTQGRPEATIEFDCPSGRMVPGVLDYTEDETGQTGSPSKVVREWLRDSLRPSDELIPVEPDDSAERSRLFGTATPSAL